MVAAGKINNTMADICPMIVTLFVTYVHDVIDLFLTYCQAFPW